MVTVTEKPKSNEKLRFDTMLMMLCSVFRGCDQLGFKSHWWYQHLIHCHHGQWGPGDPQIRFRVAECPCRIFFKCLTLLLDLQHDQSFKQHVLYYSTTGRVYTYVHLSRNCKYSASTAVGFRDKETINYMSSWYVGPYQTESLALLRSPPITSKWMDKSGHILHIFLLSISMYGPKTTINWFMKYCLWIQSLLKLPLFFFVAVESSSHCRTEKHLPLSWWTGPCSLFWVSPEYNPILLLETLTQTPNVY